MTRSSDATRPRASRGRGRVRVLLAGLIAVGMAIAGLAFAAPANAKTAFPGLELVSTTDCGYNRTTGSATLSATALLPSNSYKVSISTVAGEFQLEDEIAGELRDVTRTYDLAPGDYRAVLLEQVPPSEGWEVTGEVTFTIGACLDLDLSLTTSCSTGASGSLMVTFSDLIAGDDYSYFVEGPATSLYVPFTATGASEDVVVGDLPPGNFYVYVQWNGSTQQGGIYDWRAFAVEPCQPGLAVTLTQCTVAGGTGTANVALSNLVPGVVYTVTGPDGSTQQATAQPSGVTELSFAGLKPGATYDVSIAGTWTVDTPYEEPPFIGGGNFTPLDTVELAVSAEFTLDPCPVATTTAKPGLAATGADGVGSLVTGSLVLLGLGATALVFARSRRVGARQ